MKTTIYFPEVHLKRISLRRELRRVGKSLGWLGKSLLRLAVKGTWEVLASLTGLVTESPKLRRQLAPGKFEQLEMRPPPRHGQFLETELR